MLENYKKIKNIVAGAGCGIDPESKSVQLNNTHTDNESAFLVLLLKMSSNHLGTFVFSIFIIPLNFNSRLGETTTISNFLSGKKHFPRLKRR